MPPVFTTSRLTLRLGTFLFFTHGGVGLTAPYVALWLRDNAADASTSGWIIASPTIAMLLLSFAVGTVADRLSDWRTVILACCWMAVAIHGTLLLNPGIDGIWIAWTLGGVLLMTTVPVFDGAALSLIRRQGLHYGPVRSVGSIGFMVGVLLGGWLQQRYGTQSFVPSLITIGLLRALASLGLPRFRDGAPSAPLPAPFPPSSLLHSPSSVSRSVLRHHGFLLVIGGAALINASHAFFYALGVLHWSSIGVSEWNAGILWAVSIVAEVILLWRFRDLARRFSARACLSFAAVLSAVRWLWMADDPTLPTLFVLQSLHAVSFGLTYIATINFISRRASDTIAARAQSLSATAATAAMAVATIVAGMVYDTLGSQSYQLMSALCLAGLLCIVLSYATDLQDSSERV